MARFRFRLQKVLKVREIQEEQSKFKWAHEERLAHEERAKLARLKEHERQIKEYGYEQGEILLRQAMYNYLASLNRKVQGQELRVVEQEEAASLAKARWLEARKERKKVSILRERQYAAYVKEELSREQKALDDMRSRVLT